MGSPGTRRSLAHQSREEGLIILVEDLRTRLAEIDAYASAAEELFHHMRWNLAPAQRRNHGRLSHFLMTSAEAVSATLTEVDARMRVLMKLGHR